MARTAWLLFAVCSIVLGLWIVAEGPVAPEPIRKPVAGPVGVRVVWEERSQNQIVVQIITAEDGRIKVSVTPDHLYQQVRWTTMNAKGTAMVRVEQWEVWDERVAEPATGWGLRNLDTLREYYRVRYENLSKENQKLTLYEGPAGWLVRVRTDVPVPGKEETVK